MIRCQLPAYSPLSLARLIGAGAHALLTPRHCSEALEGLLQGRFGAREVVLTASGTHALQAALLLSARARPWAGRAVALPAYTCYDVATAAVGAGVPVTFYDVDPGSLCPDADGVRRTLERGAGVLVANSLHGFPLDWGWLREECEATGTLLVEDAAQGLGSGWGDRQYGSFGDMTVLSFSRGKGWTGGGGGALLLRSGFLDAWGGDSVLDSLALRAAGPTDSVRAFTVSAAQWMLGRPWLFGLPSSVPALALGETHYKQPTTPTAIGAFPAAAAHAHAAPARAEVSARRSGAEAWQRLLDVDAHPHAQRFPRPIEGGACGWLRFPVVAPDPAMRDRLVRVGRRLGVAPGYPRPLPALPAIRGQRASRDELPTPGARELADGLLTLPTHSKVGARDRLEIAALL